MCFRALPSNKRSFFSRKREWLCLPPPCVEYFYNLLLSGCHVCIYPRFSWVYFLVYVRAHIDNLWGSILHFLDLKTRSRSTLEASSSFDVLRWHHVQSILWYLLCWTQHMWGSLQVSTSIWWILKPILNSGIYIYNSHRIELKYFLIEFVCWRVIIIYII